MGINRAKGTKASNSRDPRIRVDIRIKVAIIRAAAKTKAMAAISSAAAEMTPVAT